MFLLEELEDSLSRMPDSIQTRFHIAKSIAITIDETLPDDSALRANVVREMRQLDQQTRLSHQHSFENIHRNRLILWTSLAFFLITLAVLSYFYIKKIKRRKVIVEVPIEPLPSQPSPLFQTIENTFEQLANEGHSPDAEGWEQMHTHLCTSYPRLASFLEEQQGILNTTELQLCLLTCTNIRQKQVATLLGVSPQNLRNLKVRLYAKLTGTECASVQVFSDFIRDMITTENEQA